MNCKHCGAPIQAGETICSACHKPVEFTFSIETIEGPAPKPAEPSVSASSADPISVTPAAEKSKLKSRKNLILGAAAVVVVLAVAMAIHSTQNQSKDPADSSTSIAVGDSTTDAQNSDEAEFVPAVSYLHAEEEFNEDLVNAIVATCGDSSLDNQKLAYYYWREYYTMLSNYSYYIYYIMDPTSPLDTQEASNMTLSYKDPSNTEDDEKLISWDMVLMDNALDSYHILSAAATAANEEQYKLTEADQSILDNLKSELDTYAEQNNLEDADAYLEACFGPYCDLESYTAFMEEYLLGASYLSAKLEEADITEDELLSYYEQQQDDYEANGITKDDTSMVNVRHILISPEAVEIAEGEEGYEEAVEAAKKAAKTKADEIYDEWKKGDQDETSFAALATEHTADTASSASGGLYENVYPGQMIAEFNDWCFDTDRAEGDTAIVETDYGYHIMYFVGETGESYWHSVVYADYQNMLYSKLCQQVQQSYDLDYDLSKAAVYSCNTAS